MKIKTKNYLLTFINRSYDHCKPITIGKCKKCGKIIKKISRYYIDFCEKCLYQNNLNQKIFKYHNIYSHGFKPNPIFHGKRKIFLGVELEIYSLINTKFNISKLNKKLKSLNLDKIFYLKEDWSIHLEDTVNCCIDIYYEADGVEIVSHPLDIITWYKIKPKIYKFFKFLKRSGFYCITKSGLHIHINKHLQHKKMNKIVDFLKLNEKKLLRLIAGRKPNNYCYLDYDFNTHYNVINYTEDTIEFRMFKATLNINYFYSKLEWVLLLSNSDINKINTNEKLANYIIRYRKKYPHIYKLFIEKRRIK